jgi:hypothetical protein
LLLDIAVAIIFNYFRHPYVVCLRFISLWLVDLSHAKNAPLVQANGHRLVTYERLDKQRFYHKLRQAGLSNMQLDLTEAKMAGAIDLFEER